MTLVNSEARDEEEQLVLRCQEGEREAFRALFERYRDSVYSLCRGFSADDSSASDLAQDVFVQLFRKIGQFRFESRFKTWLYRMTVNLCLNEQRRKKRLQPVAGLLPRLVSREAGPEAAARRGELRDSVHRSVRTLDPELQTTVLLRYLEGLSYGEIAETLDCPEGTVASRLNRAHRELAEKLEHLKGHL